MQQLFKMKVEKSAHRITRNPDGSDDEAQRQRCLASCPSPEMATFLISHMTEYGWLPFPVEGTIGAGEIVWVDLPALAEGEKDRPFKVRSMSGFEAVVTLADTEPLSDDDWRAVRWKRPEWRNLRK